MAYALKRGTLNVKTTGVLRAPTAIVGCPSGDWHMNTGTAHISYDQAKTGKHNDFTAAYSVFGRLVDGVCRTTAVMYEEVGKT